LAWLRLRLAELLPDLGDRAATLNHDAADALLAAHTARLHALGRTEVLGDAEEGQIVLPLP
jgi:predicted nuclease with RNAse H fold